MIEIGDNAKEVLVLLLTTLSTIGVIWAKGKWANGRTAKAGVDVDGEAGTAAEAEAEGRERGAETGEAGVAAAETDEVGTAD